MLGKYVRVRVTNPIRSVNRQFGFIYQLNFGVIEGKKRYDSASSGAYIMGITHPVRTFDGRVIAAIRRSDGSPTVYVVAPKSMRFISYQIEDAVAFAEKGRDYKLECLYERSCGAVVYRRINDEIRYLLIKNRRSTHWGFPKGHVEKGETFEQTAMREVLDGHPHPNSAAVRLQIGVYDTGQGREDRHDIPCQDPRHTDYDTARGNRGLYLAEF